MSVFTQETFASMGSPIFIANRNKSTYINIPDISAYSPPLASDHLDSCVIFKGNSWVRSLRKPFVLMIVHCHKWFNVIQRSFTFLPLFFPPSSLLHLTLLCVCMYVSECQCVSKSRAAVQENNCRYYQTNQQALAVKSLGMLLEATCHLSSKSVLSCGQNVSI